MLRMSRQSGTILEIHMDYQYHGVIIHITLVLNVISGYIKVVKLDKQ